MAERKKASAAAADKRKAELMMANKKRRHTISIIMFAAGLLMLLLAIIGNSAAESPSAWDHIHAFLHGLFGITAYLVGPVLMYIAVMISADLTRATVAKRMVQLMLFLLLLSAAAQVIFVGTTGDPSAADKSLGATIAYHYDKGKELSGGGVIGLLLGIPLLMFGQVGAVIILALIAFVAVMVISDKSLGDLFGAMKKPAKKIKDHREQVKEEREAIEPELRRLEEEKHLRRLEARERRNEERAAKRAENEQAAAERRRSKFDSIASVTTGAQQEVSETDKKEAAAKEKETVKVDPVVKQKQESSAFQKDLKDYLNVKYERNPMDKPPAFPVDSAPSEPFRPDAPKYAAGEEEAVPEKHLNPVVKHDSLIDPEVAAAREAYKPEVDVFAAADAAFAEANDIYNAPETHVSDIHTAVEEQSGYPVDISSGSVPDNDPPPWEDPVPPAPEPPAGYSEAALNNADAADKPQSDIVEAIKDFTREQQERARAAEDNARVLGTVISEDASGQTRFNEITAGDDQYTLPPLELLNDVVHERSDEDINAEIAHNAEKLVSTLKSFGVETKFLEASRGPSVTRYELQPAPGVKIAKITGLVDDIALNLATAGVRIEAPIPNKAAVGIEVPNKTVESVPFREMVDTKEFRETKSKLGAVLGKSISGEIVIADIAKMPHILIAGTTGSGKSVCVNSIIMSILFRSTPDEVRLLMIDPKAVEFMIYNGIPHLLIPVVTDPKKASGALAWAVTEMLNRYKMFSDHNVRDLTGFNKLAKTSDDLQPMPQIVIFIDELADLMMASPGEVEDSICRLAQMARAAGMHLVIATQRPSVNVVTGVIKANIPSRIALKVASQVDSRTIIDGAGAEKLLGKGDMLYAPVGMPKPMRVQGCWVSDKEVERVVDFIKNSFILDYDQGVIDEIERQAELAAQKAEKGGKNKGGDDEEGGADFNDDKLDEAIEAVIEAGQASTSYLQRRLKLGYGRAARLIDTMEQLGVVGGFEGSKPRQVIMTKQEWYERKMHRDE